MLILPEALEPRNLGADNSPRDVVADEEMNIVRLLLRVLKLPKQAKTSNSVAGQQLEVCGAQRLGGRVVWVSRECNSVRNELMRDGVEVQTEDAAHEPEIVDQLRV
jgi:Leu/Phe-tRNA-protein transferase